MDNPHANPDRLSSEFEREKWRDKVRLREKELSIRERKQESKDQDLKLRSDEERRSRWTNPLVLAILAAAVAATGNAFVAWLTAHEQRRADAEKAEETRIQDENKSEAERILEAIKTNNPDTAATNLKFLVEAGLIQNNRTKGPLEQYLKNRKQGQGAALPASVLFNAPPFSLDTRAVSVTCKIVHTPVIPTGDVVAVVRDILRSEPFRIAQVNESFNVTEGNVVLTWGDGVKPETSPAATGQSPIRNTPGILIEKISATELDVTARLPFGGFFGATAFAQGLGGLYAKWPDLKDPSCEIDVL
jgi:type IV secretory pathway VirB10-like protein